MSVCKLCLKDKKLLKKSHIIPNFMYEGLFDEHHKLEYFQPKTLLGENGIHKRPSNGEYQGNILCAACDNELFSRLESYASKILFAKTLREKDALTLKEIEGGNLEIANIDYTKFKLFLLSILWRASISSRPTFSRIKLGAHEDVIRKMLLNDDAGSESHYPVALFSLHKAKDLTEFIGSPRAMRFPETGHHIKFFPVQGLLFVYWLGGAGHDFPSWVTSMSIKKDNSLVVGLADKQGAESQIFRMLGLENLRIR